MPLEWPDSPPPGTHPDSKDADIRKVLLEEYHDHGEWARHYSTVRMTLGTFFITAATGIISLRWDNPDPGIAIVAAGVFLLGLALFVGFTSLTFHEMNSQFRIVKSYHRKLGSGTDKIPEVGFWKTRSGGLVVVLATVAFVALDGWWLYLSKPQTDSHTVTVPIKVSVGQAEGSVDVPLKVKTP